MSMTGIAVRAAHVSLLALFALGGPALAQAGEAQPKVTDPHFKIAPGYLKQSDLPNSLMLLGPPPEANSAALARDEEARKATIPLRNTERWKLAYTDADLAFPQAADNFSCAMGVRIDSKQTPRLYAMMQKMLSDFGLSTYGVKNKYNRVRPFVVHNEATCRADQEAILRERRLLSVRPHRCRLGLGSRLRADQSRARGCTAQARPRIRAEPRDLRRALAERRRCRADHGCGDRRAAANRPGLSWRISRPRKRR